MSIPNAILIAAALIAAALLGSQIVAPYRAVATTGSDGTQFVYRVNSFTGEIVVCPLFGVNGRAVPNCP